MVIWRLSITGLPIVQPVRSPHSSIRLSIANSIANPSFVNPFVNRQSPIPQSSIDNRHSPMTFVRMRNAHLRVSLWGLREDLRDVRDRRAGTRVSGLPWREAREAAVEPGDG